MDHEIIFLTIFIAAVVAGESLDPLMDLLVLLKVASLGELHVAEVALERLDLRVAPHV